MAKRVQPLAAFLGERLGHYCPTVGVARSNGGSKYNSVVKKLTFDVGEDVLVQNMKTGKWDTKGVITEVRVADDRTVPSYDLMIGDLLTTRHRRYLAKAHSADSGEEDKKGAPAQAGSQP